MSRICAPYAKSHLKRDVFFAETPNDPFKPSTRKVRSCNILASRSWRAEASNHGIIDPSLGIKPSCCSGSRLNLRAH